MGHEYTQTSIGIINCKHECIFVVLDMYNFKAVCTN